MATQAFSGISNALDGSARAIGRTIYANQNTAAYKAVDSTLTTNTEFDVYSQLGRMATAGYILNDSNSNSLGIKFSVDGTNYGDEITLEALEQFDFNVWLAFKKILLVHTNNIEYRLVVR